MKNDVSIEVRGVTKTYEIFGSPYQRLAAIVFGATASSVQKISALSDVSFSIRAGEVVGIIGRNGSGKSTLLQCICGTMPPTSGTIRTTGRMAALLELGAGFNPEFTGRENVFLNASLLGMRQAEIERRIPSIAEFADLGDFFERPVKTYSSGMFLRLAFSVIVHVDADILVIDEALAVGDVFFVQKCMRFLNEFRRKGTILFVSHDTAAVTGLCDRVIWLHNGQIRAEGPAKSVCERYLAGAYDEISPTVQTDPQDQSPPSEAPASPYSLWDEPERYALKTECDGFGTGLAEILQVSLIGTAGQKLSSIVGNELVTLLVRARSRTDMRSPIIGFVCKDRLGQSLFSENTCAHMDAPHAGVPCGSVLETGFVFRMPLLAAGDYAIGVAVAEGTQTDHVQHVWVHDALVFKSHCPSVSTGLVGIPMQDVRMAVY